MNFFLSVLLHFWRQKIIKVWHRLPGMPFVYHCLLLFLFFSLFFHNTFLCFSSFIFHRWARAGLCSLTIQAGKPEKEIHKAKSIYLIKPLLQDIDFTPFHISQYWQEKDLSHSWSFDRAINVLQFRSPFTYRISEGYPKTGLLNWPLILSASYDSRQDVSKKDPFPVWVQITVFYFAFMELVSYICRVLVLP